jgi:hypothetical protein
VQSLRWAQAYLWLDVTIYTFFLLTFLLSALVPFHNVAWDGYQLISTFSKFAATVEWPNDQHNFVDIHSATHFWSWWQGPFRCGLLLPWRALKFVLHCPFLFRCQSSVPQLSCMFMYFPGRCQHAYADIIALPLTSPKGIGSVSTHCTHRSLSASVPTHVKVAPAAH